MSEGHKELASEDEYLERERASEDKHEYVNGEIIAMAGGSLRHNLIAANVTGTLGERLQDKPCLVFQSDQRVNVQRTKFYTYPDVSVVCARPQVHPKDSSILLNPLVLVEVLSDSTEAYDRGAKFAHYRNLPSLSEYVLVWQAEKRIEHFRRTETGQWLLTDYQGDVAASLPALGIELSLVEVYDKVELLGETTD